MLHKPIPYCAPNKHKLWLVGDPAIKSPGWFSKALPWNHEDLKTLRKSEC